MKNPIISVGPDFQPRSKSPVALTTEQQTCLNAFRKKEPWNFVALLTADPSTPVESVDIDNHSKPVVISTDTTSRAHLENFPPKIPLDDQEYWESYFQSFCDDACLLRYLRANNWKVEESFTALIYTLNWRRKYQPHLITPNEVEAAGRSGKQYHHGFSKDGYPILYLRNYLEDSKDYRTNMRLFVYHVEHLMRSLPPGVEKLVLIFDFSKWSPSNSPPMHVSKYFLHLFASHYPERLGYVFNCNAPWIFWGFYKIIGPFINPITKAKFRFVDLKSMKQITPEKDTGDSSNILNYVDEQMLEEFFGGTNGYKFDADSYWELHASFFAGLGNEE